MEAKFVIGKLNLLHISMLLSIWSHLFDSQNVAYVAYVRHVLLSFQSIYLLQWKGNVNKPVVALLL